MWKYTIASLLFWLFSNSLAHSQISSRLSDWKISSPASDVFVIDSLVELEEKFSEPKNDARTFSGEFDNRWFRVFSIKANKESNWRIVTDFVAANRKSFTLPPAPSERSSVSFVDEDGFCHYLSAISTKARVYIAHAVVLDNENDRIIGKRFAASLKLDEQKSLNVSTVDESENLISPTGNKDRLLGGIASSGGISSNAQPASSSPNGIGAGPPVNNNTAKSQDEISRLKILSKPRPPYTDLARFYEIQGSLILRIVFKADGTIGDIQVASRLPFGLTETAIQAAKRITFEPASINGKSQGTMKSVQYSFTIY